jgi:O-acetyl-ADP-ribose deacetylase (regulator of RNase III)
MATITIKQGDILQETTDALVNTVNCVGVMGRGIALQFKQQFPANFKAYAQACQRQEVVPGRMFVFAIGQLTPPYYIINFPTKRHWRGKSRMEDIDAGLIDLVQQIQHYGIQSVAIPPLGSGLGGLDWQLVRPRIEQALRALPDLQVVLYEPSQEPQIFTPTVRATPTMTPGRATLVALMDHYLQGLMDPFITLLEVHKLLYFLQEAGEPLRLRFVRGPYGPYAENLRHVLQAIDGYFITGYGDGGDEPEKVLHVVPGAVTEASHVLHQSPATQARLHKVTELVEGFETFFGLELLATVHWVCVQEKPQTAEQLVQAVHRWAKRKQMFVPRQILLAQETLVGHGWLEKAC